MTALAVLLPDEDPSDGTCLQLLQRDCCWPELEQGQTDRNMQQQ